jgi:hypothetical protein
VINAIHTHLSEAYLQSPHFKRSKYELLVLQHMQLLTWLQRVQTGLQMGLGKTGPDMLAFVAQIAHAARVLLFQPLLLHTLQVLHALAGVTAEEVSGSMQRAMTYPSVSGSLANVSRTAGIPLGSIADGASKTLIIAESRERGYAGWIDGTATWVVAMNLSGPLVNYSNNVWVSDTTSNTAVVTASGTTKGVGLNFAASGTSQFLPSGDWSPYNQVGSPKYGMAWGASSEHAGGVSLHAFADAHIAIISADIDTQIYPALYSRGKNEPVQDY